MRTNLILLRARQYSQPSRQSQIAVTNFVGAGWIAATRQCGLVNRYRAGDRIYDYRVYRNGKRCGRQIAIAIPDGVNKGIRAARIVRIGCIAVAAARIQRQRAQCACDHGTCTRQYRCSSVIACLDAHHTTCDIFAVCAKNIIRLNPLRRSRRERLARGYCAGIEARSRHIVNNNYVQRAAGAIAILVGNRYRKAIRCRVACCALRQGVAVPHRSIARNRVVGKVSHRQGAEVSADRLARAGYHNAFQRYSVQTVYGIKGQAAGRGLAIGCRLAAGGQTFFSNL